MSFLIHLIGPVGVDASLSRKRSPVRVRYGVLRHFRSYNFIVIYNLEHNIKFERNKNGFEYNYENKTYKYYPDFILDDGTYIEIKNFLTKQEEEKINQFKYKLKILFKKDIQYMFDYVIDKYGKNFIQIYE